ncbi:MAG: hypothetical protein HZB16_03190 [Armatimonadetes bacterium]|nr:hypothetical protein [Armatimonadota bacterium]
MPELVWRGKYGADGARSNLVPSASPVLLARRERHRGAGWGLLAWGDNVAVADAWLAEFAGQVDLIYLDPPFGVGEAFAVNDQHGAAAYDDRWPDVDAYLAFMDARLAAAQRLLAPTGSLWLHCDHHTGPLLALLCDERFGRGDRERNGSPGFRNEVIWHYGLGGSSARCYAKKHDLLLWYSASSRWHFEPPMVPATSQRMAGLDKKCPDVWAIPSINNQAHERTGYPTQKPEPLLERIIASCSRPGDLVADLFCGSGTTLAVAGRLGRRWLGCDAGPVAIATCRRRLSAAGLHFELHSAEPLPAFDASGLAVRCDAGYMALVGDVSGVEAWFVIAGDEVTWLHARSRGEPVLATVAPAGEAAWVVDRQGCLARLPQIPRPRLEL